MKKALFVILAILITITMLGETKALIIGVGEYDDERVTDLPGAIKDAEQFKETLLSLGIVEEDNLTYITNPSLAQITSHIFDWARKGNEEDKLIFYYAGHGYAKDGSTYLVPSDADASIIERTGYNFTRDMETLTKEIKTDDVLIIMDACYSGSLMKDRPIENPRIEKSGIEQITKEKGYSFLFSSQPKETSLERKEEGGYFTYYLIEGMKGKANKDKNEYIELKELYEYTKEEVERATNDKQHPMLISERNLVIAKDMSETYKEILFEVLSEPKIKQEYKTIYSKILIQPIDNDTKKEKGMRQVLIKYHQYKDIDYLITKTKEIYGETKIDEEKEEYTVQTQTKGNCLIKIIPMNELAKRGTVYLDGEEKGTLERGLLVIKDVASGRHTIKIDSEEMDTIEQEIELTEYEVKDIKIEGEPAKRWVRITTQPPGAKIYINGKEQESITPIQMKLEIGKEYEIQAIKEQHGKETRKIRIPVKGEMIPFNITIPWSPYPEKPRLTYPENNEKEITPGEITLRWEGNKEENITYRIEIEGKEYTTNNRYYTIKATERGKEYSWRVTAINEYGNETTSDTYYFTTKENTSPNRPTNPTPSTYSNDQSTDITLTWECTDPDGDNLTYDVYFGTSSNPSYKTTTYTNKYNPGNLKNDTRYYWKIVAKDGKGGETTGYVWRFTTKEEPNQDPDVPDNPNPSNYAQDVSTSPTLSWDCGDPNGDSLTYDIYFGTSYNLPLKKSDLTSTSYSPGKLSYETRYYWKIVAKDGEGGKTTGYLWNFTTKDKPNQDPYVPDNTNPSNYTQNVSTSQSLETKALIIGVGEYDDERVTDLPGAIKDAEQFKETLLSLGIVEEDNLTYLTNPTGNQLTSNIFDWARKGTKEDKLIFYYAGHGYTLEENTYLIPSDINTNYIAYTGYNFTKNMDQLTKEIETDDVLIIMDACYSGSLIKDRPIENPRIEKSGIEQITKEKGYSFLFSSQPKETSLERLEGGGYFTYYLIEGMKGKANKDENEYVELKELYEYTKEEVERATNDKQHPMVISARDFVIAKDISMLYEDILDEVTADKDLPAEYITIYIKILRQQESRDTEEEKEIRDALLIYHQIKDAELLIMLTEKIIGTIGQQHEGNCVLKLIAKNELAKEGIVYVDGERRGELREGILEVDNLSVGTHNVLIDSNTINPEAIKVEFDNEYEVKTVNFEAVKALEGTEPEQEEKEEYTVQTKTRGNCLIKIIPMNELAKRGTVYLDGKEIGTFDQGLVIEDVASGRHTIKIDSEEMDTIEQEIELTEYEVKVIEIEGEPAKRWVMITTEGMVLVEGGTFQMGSNSGDSDEKPIHEVTLTYDFYIGKYEVTFEEYDEYCEDTGKNKPDDEGWGRGQHPVINVSWWDAIEYCNWLSEKEGLPKAYDEKGNLLDKYGNETTDITEVEGYRLPTEAEWEYAARGGKYSNGYKYAGSDDLNEVAWYDDNSGGHTHEVGTKEPNELRIQDMSGNVWEWCQDWYDNDYYEISPNTNPYNHEAGSTRVLRGGCWSYGAYYVRVANRFYNNPGRTTYSYGFRICRTVY